MRAESRSARTRYASGRFVAVLLLSACQTVGAPGSTGGPGDAAEVAGVGAEGGGARTFGPVVVVPGEISDADQREAAELWAAAQGSLEAHRLFEVLRTTEEILSRFPGSEVSGDALHLTARTEFELGRLNRADQAAERYVRLLQPNDPRGVDMRLLQAQATAGDPERQLDRLLRIEEVATPEQQAEATPSVREAADVLRYDELRGVVDGVGEAAGPLMAIAEARLAVTLLELGQGADASLYAQRAIDDGVEGEERAWAEGVLLGELPEGRGRETAFSIGLVLPAGGPPALAEFAMLIQEGVEVAATTALGEEYTVTVLVRDDEGDPERTAEVVAELEAEGVAGIVGMLQDADLVAAAQARTEAIPLVSPTARSASRSGEGAYSLEGADPEAAAAVARYAVSRAFQRVAIVLPQTPEAQVEADAFSQAADELGMNIVGRFAYEAGATFFEPQIRAARDALRSAELGTLGLIEDDTLHMEVLEPAAIFLPVPPEDVEFLAPQLIHFGLDTLAIELLGTSGWTDAQTLDIVDTRVTTGIVATQAIGTGAGSAGDLRFRDAYESTFQRSLVGGTPAIGYDAALLLLEALRPGRIAAEEVNRSMARLSEIEGATGLFSVVDGRVVRATRVVRIQNRVPEPETAGWPATFDLPVDSVGLAPGLPGDSTGLPGMPVDSAVTPDTGTVAPVTSSRR